jgi:hypothetical protein
LTREELESDAEVQLIIRAHLDVLNELETNGIQVNEWRPEVGG